MELGENNMQITVTFDFDLIRAEMNTEFKRDEMVLRWLTVKLDKFAAEYAVRRKTRLNETKESSE